MNEIKHAIDGFKELKPILQSQLLKTNCEGLGIEDAKELGQHFDIAIKCMEHQLANRWIPCSERFPNMEECQRNDCRFIVTDGSRGYQSHYDYTERVFGEPFHHNTMNFYIDKCIIAWQPLPEKYKEDEIK